jgi:MFS family permease
MNRMTAVRFIVLLGVVSLFADMTYEGARSITGPYLAMLGASAAAVGFIAGFGELIGYSLRLVSGYLSDRTGRYWTFTLVGYSLNLLVVPLLALTGRWETAAALMIAERMGKALRTPARDAMLSHATKEVERGWGFGLHEAMDQIGAMTGPLIVAVALAFRGSYEAGFGVLLLPALLAMSVLVVARWLYPRPQELEPVATNIQSSGLPRIFWLYLGGVALLAAGFADFPLIAFHFELTGTVPSNLIPVFYAVAMGVDALAALVFGRLYDRRGLVVLTGVALFSALFAPLVFTTSFWAALAGMVLWGVSMGAQESVMRAAVASMISPDRRGSAYGVFNTGYGVAWFIGSVVMGILYDISLPTLIAFSVLSQLAAVPMLYRLSKERVV